MKDLPVIIPENTALDKLSPKHLRFLVQYLKIGNATEAYLKVFRTKNRVSAGSNSWKLVNKYKDIKKILYEANGLAEKDMIAAIKGALSANKVVVDKQGNEHISADHAIRLKAVEIRNKALGEDGESTQKIGNQMNIVIVKDKVRGMFSMGEEADVS